MKNPAHYSWRFALPTLVIALAVAAAAVQVGSSAEPGGTPLAERAALAVKVIQPVQAQWPLRIAANGDIAAWQEASVGTQTDGLVLSEVRVNVGDSVRRGQVLAVFEAAPVAAEYAHSRAVLAEAEASLGEAAANGQRARDMQASGVLSEQQIHQYLTEERKARARLAAAQALAETQRLRLAQTHVLAPDDAVISARSATVGAVPTNGQELFRLIRRGRLEWRAEVAAPQLARLKPGQVATVTPVGGDPVRGTLRMVSPVVDTQTRSGLVYVDLPAGSVARAGMFARGDIEIGSGSPALTLPQAAVLLREGFHCVLKVGPDSRVVQTKVQVGQRAGDRIEILSGLDADSEVVAAGIAFLADGDLVQVSRGGSLAPGSASTK
jgi:RND family efflux transporter MFP subunit